MLVLPLLIMGVVSCIGGVLTFRLPETLQQKLPNTLAEGEAFGQDFSWDNCLICVPERLVETQGRRDAVVDCVHCSVPKKLVEDKERESGVDAVVDGFSFSMLKR